MILLIISIIITLVVIVRNTLGRENPEEVNKKSTWILLICSLVAIIGMVIVDHQQGFNTKAIHMATTSIIFVVIPFCTMIGKPIKTSKWILVAIWVIIFIIISHYLAGAVEEINDWLVKLSKKIIGFIVWVYEKGKEWRRSL